MPAIRGHERNRQTQAGYVLLTLLLLVTLLIIVSAAAAPKIAFAIKRDQEQEMIHRGVQYTRAIRAFSRKFGRYPSTLDELQNTNGQRFLRKRYKDPITGQEFKLLHLTDVQISGGAGVAALTQGSQRAQEQNANETGAASAATSSASDQDPNAPADPNATPSNSLQGNSQNVAIVKTSTAGSETEVDTIGTSRLSAGPIIGVASASRKLTIREFGHKNHYSDWKFYYDPGYDRGFLIKGPTIPMSLTNATLRPGETSDSTSPQSSQPSPPQ